MNTALNYHHLRYFLAVADRGGIKAASDFLHVSPPTLSAQIHELEDFLKTPLFIRERRRLTLTETGRTVQQYAGRIFGLGDELIATVKYGEPNKSQSILLGLADTVPKLMASRLLEQTWKVMPDLRIVIREGLPTELFPALASHQLDIVLANEEPASVFKNILASRLTARFGIYLLATQELRRTYRSQKGLAGFPMLLPPRESALRRELERWWSENNITPNIRAEFDDSAAMYELAAAGMGAAPAVGPVVRDVKSRYNLVELPVKTEIHEALYVVTAERQFAHEGIRLLTQFARELSNKKT